MAISITDKGDGWLFIKCECGCERDFKVSPAQAEKGFRFVPGYKPSTGIIDPGGMIDPGNLTRPMKSVDIRIGGGLVDPGRTMVDGKEPPSGEDQ